MRQNVYVFSLESWVFRVHLVFRSYVSNIHRSQVARLCTFRDCSSMKMIYVTSVKSVWAHFPATRCCEELCFQIQMFKVQMFKLQTSNCSIIIPVFEFIMTMKIKSHQSNQTQKSVFRFLSFTVSSQLIWTMLWISGHLVHYIYLPFCFADCSVTQVYQHSDAGHFLGHRSGT